MKYVKMLGLAVVAAAALMAFVGSSTASATDLCKTEGIKNGGVTGTTCPLGWAMEKGEEIHAINEGVLKLTTSFKNIECNKSTLTAKLENEGAEAERVTLEVTSKGLTFEECNCEVVVVNPGTLEIEWIAGTHNGKVFNHGAEVTATCSTIFGNVHCIYTTGAGIELGIATGSSSLADKTATIDINEANIPRLVTNSLCAEQAKWDAKYEITTPDTLNVAGET